MELIEINIDDYKPHPKNPNSHPSTQIGEIIRSLDKFKQYKNVVVWRGFYIAGHGLVEAARLTGLKTISAVDMSHLSEHDAVALMVADNRLPELSSIDNSVLADLLKNFDDPVESIPGVDDDFLNEILGMIKDSPIQTVDAIGNSSDGKPSVNDIRAFTPNTNPEYATSKDVNEDNIKRAKDDLEHRFRRDDTNIDSQINLICPHCSSEFSIRRKDL